MSNKVKLIECPRDAMQGLTDFIPTEDKIRYLNKLLQVGFDSLDFGSFVSPKAIPQMRDTEEVLQSLDYKKSSTHLLAIVANERGAETAVKYPFIKYLGFPLSLSETFQQRNTNRSITEAFETIRNIQSIASSAKQELVVYLSMGFGNPYGDEYSPEYVKNFTGKLHSMGIRIVSLADTIGVAEEKIITSLFQELIPAYPEIEFGAHLHSVPAAATKKIDAAYQAGCRRFDGAIRGFGGCPMAKDDLTGNLAMETLIAYLENNKIASGINQETFVTCLQEADKIFPIH